MYEAPALYIDGKDIRPTKTPTLEVVNPATEEIIGRCPTAGSEEVAEAIASAGRGLVAWGKISAWDRSGILRKAAALLRERASSIAPLITMEVGKTLSESKNEIKVGSDTIDWCADEARRVYDWTLPGRSANSHFEISHEPAGIALGLTSWNAPISLSSRKLAMSLAAGCSMILRPAEEAPASVAALVRCFHDAGVPAGVINLIYGTPEAVIKPLMAAPDVRVVSFTGSTRVGQILIRESAETLKRLALELGGHAPVFVMEDADIGKVASSLADRKIRNSGQVCTAPSRFFVHEAVVDEFSDKFVKKMSSVKLGDGLNADVQMGPLTTSRQRDRTERLVDDARRKGATVATGGERPPELNRGYFYRPTVLTNVPDNAQILTEEPFCPVAVILPISDVEEALSRANSTEAALAAYVFTKSGARADYITRHVQAGVVALNNYQVASAEAPFGGMKAGGYGREGGVEGVMEYLNVKFKHKTDA
jgi:succinate-semialdehyde dehydrogenase/glutarate-semialdehyde dehydrogenase